MHSKKERHTGFRWFEAVYDLGSTQQQIQMPEPEPIPQPAPVPEPAPEPGPPVPQSDSNPKDREFERLWDRVARLVTRGWFVRQSS